MSNTITAYFKGRVGVAESVYQNDYGIVMVFDSIDLPAHFDCYFSKLNQEEALPGVGADNMVTIPNSILANPGNVTIHIPLHTGENDSEVEYVIYFKVIGRARPMDDGTPTQMTAIEQALALLQNPITNIEQIVNEALSFTGDTFDEMQDKLDADQAEFQEDMLDRAEDFESGINTRQNEVEADFDLLNAQVSNLTTNVKANSVETLWTGSLDTVGSTATLSKSVANYDFIDIYSGSTDRKFTRLPANAGVAHLHMVNLSDDTDNFLQVCEFVVSFSGTSLSITRGTFWNWDGLASDPATVSSNVVDHAVIRIDGVKVGSSTPAELTDMRVGADGHTYSSAGDAIRAQLLKTLMKKPATSLGGVDLDTLHSVGIYWHGSLDGTVTNLPTELDSTAVFLLMVFEANDTNSTYKNCQVLITYGVDTKIFYRVNRNTTTFNNWIKVVQPADISSLEGWVGSIDNALTGIVKIKNLFNKAHAVTGGYFSDTGGITANANSFYGADYIPVSAGTYYYYKGDDKQLLYCTYNSSRDFIERINAGTAASGSIAIGSGVAFIRPCIYGTSDPNALTISTVEVRNTLPYVYGLYGQVVGFDNLMNDARTVHKSYNQVPLSHPDVTNQAGYYGDYGDFTANGMYQSIYYQVGGDCDCYFDSNATYYSICVFSGLPLTRDTCIQHRLRHSGSEDTAPKVNSKLSLKAGQYVAITVLSTDTNSGFYTNDTMFGITMNDNVLLSSTQLAQISGVSGVGCLAIPYGSGNNAGVYVFVPTGYGYLRYDFKHNYNASINCDTWRINSLYSVDDNFNERFLATTSGEWECAVRLSGRPDFSGGVMHGDEVTTSIVFLFDGVPYDAAALATMGRKRFKELRIVEISTLYDPNDNETEIAEHYKEYIFDNKDLHLLQHVDWKITDALSSCFLAMLTPSKEYTDMYYSDKELEPVTSLSAYGDHAGVKRAVQYSSDEGFLCSLEILQYPTGLPGSDIFNLRDNSGGDYNKMYFNVCTSGNITAGTRWTAEAVYAFSVGEPIE